MTRKGDELLVVDPTWTMILGRQHCRFNQGGTGTYIYDTGDSIESRKPITSKEMRLSVYIYDSCEVSSERKSTSVSVNIYVANQHPCSASAVS
jgi:hypothetical protein